MENFIVENFKSEQKKTPQKAWEVVKSFVGEEQLKTDPLGSWTGNPREKNEVPVQDVDDL